MGVTTRKARSNQEIAERIVDEMSDDGGAAGDGTHTAPAKRRIVKRRSIARDYSNAMYVEDVSVSWLYRPHTLTLLFSFVAYVLWEAFRHYGQKTTFADDVLVGVRTMVIAFLFIGLLVFPNGPFIRPHPIIWRFVFGVSVAYLLFLVFLLFLKVGDARRVLSFITSEGTVVAPIERGYAEDCSLTWPILKGAILDRYVIAHAIGWFCKSLMIRNRAICWIVSIGWEIAEITLTHHLENFKECWWDSWLMDVLICNGLGIELGYRLCLHFEVQTYEWTGFLETPTTLGKIKRAMLQLTPSSWTHVEWETTKNLRRFLGIHLLILVLELKDLNSFYLKHILWIPSHDNINVYRLALWWVIGLPTLRQVYIYMTDDKVKRLGSQAWVALAMLIVELLVIIKFGWTMFPKPMPDHIKIMWAIIAPIYMFFCVAVVSQRGSTFSSQIGRLASPSKSKVQ